MKSGKKRGSEKGLVEREEQNLSWVSTCCSQQPLQAAPHLWGAHRHCHNQIHANGDLQINFPCTITAKHEHLRMSSKYKRQIVFWRREGQNLDQEKYMSACDTHSCTAAKSQVVTPFTCAVGQWHKLPVVHQPAVPNVQPAGRTCGTWRIYSVPLHSGSHLKL